MCPESDVLRLTSHGVSDPYSVVSFAVIFCDRPCDFAATLKQFRRYLDKFERGTN